MGDIKNVDVPSVPRPELSLAEEYRGVSEGLSRFKQELIDADDELLAETITVEPYGARVRFHPKALDRLESDEPFTIEQMLEFRYRTNYPAMTGLKNFEIRPNGAVHITVFEHYTAPKEQYGWGDNKVGTSDQVNEALTGLVTQHNALLADRQAHSVAGVTVPSVGK